MATRGHLGGVARSTGDAALVLDAAGFDIVIVETVGVGQDEVDIIRMADVSVVALVPGTGDDVQALKAGIMEIADIFVVNKSDREGADRLVSAVEGNLGLHTYSDAEWRPPIVKTVASKNVGTVELDAAIEKHFEYLKASGELDRRNRERVRIRIELEREVHGASGRRSRRGRIKGPRGSNRRPRGGSHTAAETLLARALKSSKPPIIRASIP
jgi:LAO/AO transport system kinase